MKNKSEIEVFLKDGVSIFFVLYQYAFFYYLPAVLPPLAPDTIDVIKGIPMVMGGGSAIYSMFLARTNFSKRMSLLSFLFSTLTIFEIYHVHDIDIGFLIMIISLLSFYFSFHFISKYIDIDRSCEIFFFLLLTVRIFISPEMAKWEMALVLQLIFLFSFSFLEDKAFYLQKKRIFFSIIILFILFFLYMYVYNIYLRDCHLVVVFVLALAAAGAIQFLFLSKTDLGQYIAFSFYFMPNVILGFILSNEGDTFPKMTLYFIGFNAWFIISLWMIRFIQGEKLSKVIYESKTSLCAIYLPLLYLLFPLFLSKDNEGLDAWIASFSLQILILQLLTFILKKEEP